MAYLLRTYLKKKYIGQALGSVYGIGNSLSTDLCHRLGFQKNFLLKNLTDEDIYHIDKLVTDLRIPIKGDLQRFVKQKVDHLASIRSYRGIRHRQGYPTRGQRTHTNAQTVKKLKRVGRPRKN